MKIWDSFTKVYTSYELCLLLTQEIKGEGTVCSTLEGIAAHLGVKRIDYNLDME
jgi:hypothetical protein